MSNTEQQIQEVRISIIFEIYLFFSSYQLNADIDEIKSLVDQSNRPRVKQYLELQQRRLETELITLKEKTAAATTATAATEKKPTATVPSTTNRSYTKEITLYGKRIGMVLFF